MDGQDKLAFNMKAVLDFRESLPDLISDETIRQLKKWDAGERSAQKKMHSIQERLHGNMEPGNAHGEADGQRRTSCGCGAVHGRSLDIYWHSSDGSRRGIFGEKASVQRCKAEAKGQKRREKLLESKNRDEHFKVSPDDIWRTFEAADPGSAQGGSGHAEVL